MPVRSGASRVRTLCPPPRSPRPAPRAAARAWQGPPRKAGTPRRACARCPRCLPCDRAPRPGAQSRDEREGRGGRRLPLEPRLRHDAPEFLHTAPQSRPAGGNRERPGFPPRSAPCLCDRSARGGCRLALRPGDAGPCRSFHYPDLHPCESPSPPRDGGAPSPARGAAAGVVKIQSRDEVVAALPAGARALVAPLLDAADRRNVAVYLVGGPVRDLMLGRVLRDVDLIVEPQDGQGAAELVRAASLLGVGVVSHDRFGTLRLESSGRATEEEVGVDLATVRSERYAHPGALPTVGPGTLEDDLRRRDFTVNALALPLSAAARRARPPIMDLEDGLRDLEARTLRVFHAASFHDDPTRALRAARLAARLGFTLSRSSRSALRDALRDGAFGRVSGERLKREIDKLFEDARLGLDPAVALGLLSEWHVLGA